ncbi:MAG: hypothetical protein LBL13_09985 [Bacteroidales bacterium]|nr:hypothetical protein [Bacteroidales bacterium]
MSLLDAKITELFEKYYPLEMQKGEKAGKEQGNKQHAASNMQVSREGKERRGEGRKGRKGEGMKGRRHEGDERAKGERGKGATRNRQHATGRQAMRKKGQKEEKEDSNK